MQLSYDTDGDGFDDGSTAVDSDMVDWSAGTKAAFELQVGECQVVEAVYYEDRITVEDGSTL